MSCFVVCITGGSSHNHGHCARWFWLHVGLRGPGLGSLHIQPAGCLPGGAPTGPKFTRSSSYNSTEWYSCVRSFSLACNVLCLMVRDGDVDIFVFAIRCWILYFQKIQLTEEPVQTRPYTSKCCKLVIFYFFLFSLKSF